MITAITAIAETATAALRGTGRESITATPTSMTTITISEITTVIPTFPTSMETGGWATTPAAKMSIIESNVRGNMASSEEASAADMCGISTAAGRGDSGLTG